MFLLVATSLSGGKHTMGTGCTLIKRIPIVIGAGYRRVLIDRYVS